MAAAHWISAASAEGAESPEFFERLVRLSPGLESPRQRYDWARGWFWFLGTGEDQEFNGGAWTARFTLLMRF